MSPPLLPIQAPERIQALEDLEHAIAADAWASVDMMVGEGWPPASAADAYRSWLHGLIDDAIDFGTGLWQASRGEAA